MRDRRGWQRKGLLIVAVFGVMMVGWYLDQNYGKGLRIGFGGVVFLCIGIAIFVGFLPDLGVSEVEATDEGVARAFYGHAVGASLWRYQDILHFSLVPSNVSGKPFSLLILRLRTNIAILGVPSGVSRTEIVEFFQRHGVQEARDDGDD
jgi:hypothetical protein